ncbi:MAG TPA: ribosome biogenesis GTPase Der [Gemmatimonadales bacterium]|nr:ribosome biogenesis GTPase Der [Gemmatimonadales bacterium]
MSQPTVAIVGRPNVGKSTLFNRIQGGRAAIVSERAGTTRDRHFGTGEWGGRRFWLVDTGGLVPGSSDSMDVAVRRQVELALEEADLIVFVVDGREGPSPVDLEIAARLRRAQRPVVLAVNKLDELPDTTGHLAFYELGLGEPLPVSAAVGKASGDLLDAIVAALPPGKPRDDEDQIEVAVVGRPNAGKSSIINRLLGEERLVVSPEPGTTRDAIDTPLRYRGNTLNFIDTAGLRRRSKVEDDIEFYATLRTHRAIERADVAVLVVDAERGMHAQDLRIATEAWDAGAGLVVAVNKWDLIPDKDANTAKRGQDLLIEKAPFLRYVPFVYLSATTGQRLTRIPELILEVAAARDHRVPTAEVNRVLEQLLARNAPPQQPGEEVKLLYASQVGTRPPLIAIVSNRPDEVPEAYQRYLANGFRAAWGFTGAPLRLKFTARGAGQHDRRDDGRRVRGAR